MEHVMDELASIGVPVILHDQSRVLGVAHVPYPVEVGDVACLTLGPLWRLVRLMDDGSVAFVERVKLTIVAR